MLRTIAGVLLTATVATAALTGPAGATTATAAAGAATTTARTTATTAAGTVAESAAKRHLVRYKIYFGRCKDTCRIKVRITNTSRTTLHDVSLNARLRVNGRKAGTCYDHVGKIAPKRTRWGGCTVRSATLSRMWNRWLDGEIRFDKKVNTTVAYKYYR